MLGLSTETPDKPNAVLSNILNIKTDTKDDNFSLLLKSFSFGKLEDTTLPEGLEKLDALLQLDEKAKIKKSSDTSPLSKLFALGHEELKDEELIHSDIIKALPGKTFKQDLQQLIGEAKSFLKEQISLKADIKDLPKTLGGLIKLAEKSGIDVRAISFESLSKTALKEEISQALQLNKPVTSLPQTGLPHSTSQLVKPLSAPQSEKEEKPLNALLNKTIETLSHTNIVAEESIKTGKAPLFDASLSSLLHGEKSESTTESESSSKLEISKSTDNTQLISQSKTEQLSQKVTEAKQLIQHVAQSMKESVENYKPPFTRIKMQLNPQKFGDMEVTLVQRGNNVHININANSTALTVMMQNSHELKAQLSAQGLGDASMNFTSHQQQQQEQKQRQEHAGLTYEEFQEYEEEFTEMATALEIVVPRYI